MKYNRAEIMKSAWEIRKTSGVTMSETLKTAWGVAKIKVGANPMDDTVQEYFRRPEAADKALCMKSPKRKSTATINVGAWA